MDQDATLEPRVVQKEGFTVLQDGGTHPDLDIVFVHGLQGHPKNTWTYQPPDGSQNRSTDQSLPSEKKARGLRKIFQRSNKGENHGNTVGDAAKASTTQRKPVQETFWPRDLLRDMECCKRARIMTYGYDTDIIKMVDTANFTSISDEGETLLNAIARVRAEDQRRPLMFIVHSLGGLVVKKALNLSRSQLAPDLVAIFQSTFAIMFFGTPHRGSFYADSGLAAAKAVSLLTFKPFNDRVLRNLADNSEVLMNIRKDFTITVDEMLKNNEFESSSFQEQKGLSSMPGFQAKVVEDDSSEMGIRADRNDHINQNHVDMCKFSSFNDPGFEKVAGEIKRHIRRLQGQLGEAQRNLLSSLDRVGRAAESQRSAIEATPGTMDWIFDVRSHRPLMEDTSNSSSSSLRAWLMNGTDMFWITGRPGSGKSTVMNHIMSHASTELALDQEALNQHHQQAYRTHVVIGLFITNRADESQRIWKTMQYGLLLQLLRQQPLLVRFLLEFLREKEIALNHHNHRQTDLFSEYTWSEKTVCEALYLCMNLSQYPFQAVVVVDGLDELTDNAMMEDAIAFLKDLTERSRKSHGRFKVCVSSRSEQLFNDSFQMLSRIEIHRHTRDDIRLHIRAKLSTHPRRKEMQLSGLKIDLEAIVDFIADGANGVFLWASSVTVELCEALRRGEPLGDLYTFLSALPKDMHNLYAHILQRIEPNQRRKAYIMLEVILRAREPLTVLELCMITHVTERILAGKANPWSDRVSIPVITDFTDPARLCRQLVSACRCILQTSSRFERQEVYPESSSGGSQHDGITEDGRNDRDDLSEDAESAVLLGRDSVLGDTQSECIGDNTTIAQIGSKAASETTSPNAEHEIITSSVDGPDRFSETASELHDDRRMELSMFDLMTESQYRDYYGNQMLDPAHDTVQLLHRSARDYLLECGCLDTLFEPHGSQFTTTIEKPRGNGHAFIIYFIRAWIQLDTSVHMQLRCSFDFVSELTYHAAQLEPTLDQTVLEDVYPVLDDIDLEATRLYGDARWPAPWFESMTGVRLPKWHITFPVYAVSMDMRGYIEHLLRQADEFEGRDHFVNGKPGRPLLHFAVFSTVRRQIPPRPAMAKLLLRNGANVSADFEGKTAIQSMQLSMGDSQQFDLIGLLLDHDADPNSADFPIRTMCVWHPVIHAGAHALPGVHPRQALKCIAAMVNRRADLNAQDSAGRTLLEVLYWHDKMIHPNHWHWLLQKGAKITPSLLSRKYRVMLLLEEGWSSYEHCSRDDYSILQSLGYIAKCDFIDDGESENQRVLMSNYQLKSVICHNDNDHLEMRKINDICLSEGNDANTDLTKFGQPQRAGTGDSFDSFSRRWQIDPLPRTIDSTQLQRRGSGIELQFSGADHDDFLQKRYRGLCDRDGTLTSGYHVLIKEDLRRREYYTEEAAIMAEKLCSGWFNNA